MEREQERIQCSRLLLATCLMGILQAKEADHVRMPCFPSLGTSWHLAPNAAACRLPSAACAWLVGAVVCVIRGLCLTTLLPTVRTPWLLSGRPSQASSCAPHCWKTCQTWQACAGVFWGRGFEMRCPVVPLRMRVCLCALCMRPCMLLCVHVVLEQTHQPAALATP